MCELYVKADPILYESRSRSLRIRGVVTTLRLENQFWDILREIAEVLNITESRVSQIHSAAIVKMKNRMINY